MPLRRIPPSEPSVLRGFPLAGGWPFSAPVLGAVLATVLGMVPVLVASPAAAQVLPEQASVDIPGTELALTLAHLPAGQFQMGSPVGEAGRDDDEGPAHAVALPAFWISTHEITHAQYSPFRFENFDGDQGPTGPGSFDVDAVTRPSPPYEDPSHGMGGDEHPVAGVTRWNALHYARWLSEKTGRLFRLPTEAEWEYACRAGGDGATGITGTAERAGSAGTAGTTAGTAGTAAEADAAALAQSAWLETQSGGTPHPVGGLEPNAWGLFDMLGNVAEWVMDGYQATAYTRTDATAGSGPGAAIAEPLVGEATRGRGLVRGGAFDDPATEARCAARYPEAVAWKRRDPQIPKSPWWNTDSPHVGFRLVSPDRAYTLDEITTYFDELLGG